MNITSIRELKKHIGEFLAFESHNPNGHLAYVWIQKLQKVGTKRDNIPMGKTEIYHLSCYSLFSAEVYPHNRPYSGLHTTNYHTNAQDVIRTPTKEEMKKYMMTWRKFKILGRYE